MKNNNYVIKKTIFCVFDRELPYVKMNEILLGEEDEITRYISQLLGKYFNTITAKSAKYTEEDFLWNLVPSNVDQLEAFANYVAEEIHSLLIDNAELDSGSGMFLYVEIEGINYVVFVKLNYQSKFFSAIDADGKVSWKQNSKIIPSASQKQTEYFFINLVENTVSVSDTLCYIQNEKVNYLAETILQLNLQRSEKELLEDIDSVVIETIKKNYKDIPKKVLEYKQSLAEEVEESGTINLKTLEETIFAGNEKAQEEYKEKLIDNNLTEKPIEVSKKLERKITKKQKIVTDSGIELLVPVELLKDSSILEYRQSENGRISIIIKEIESLENR